MLAPPRLQFIAARSIVEAAEATCDGESSTKLHIVIIEEKIILLMNIAQKSVRMTTNTIPCIATTYWLLVAGALGAGAGCRAEHM